MHGAATAYKSFLAFISSQGGTPDWSAITDAYSSFLAKQEGTFFLDTVVRKTFAKVIVATPPDLLDTALLSSHPTGTIYDRVMR